MDENGLNENQQSSSNAEMNANQSQSNTFSVQSNQNFPPEQMQYQQFPFSTTGDMQSRTIDNNANAIQMHPPLNSQMSFSPTNLNPRCSNQIQSNLIQKLQNHPIQSVLLTQSSLLQSPMNISPNLIYQQPIPINQSPNMQPLIAQNLNLSPQPIKQEKKKGRRKKTANETSNSSNEKTEEEVTKPKPSNRRAKVVNSEKVPDEPKPAPKITMTLRKNRKKDAYKDDVEIIEPNPNKMKVRGSQQTDDPDFTIEDTFRPKIKNKPKAHKTRAAKEGEFKPEPQTPPRQRSRGSERSVRHNDNLMLQDTSGNPLDIWVISAPFFQKLPTNKEIEDICNNTNILQTPQKCLKVKQLSSISDSEDELENSENLNWLEQMRQVALNSSKAPLVRGNSLRLNSTSEKFLPKMKSIPSFRFQSSDFGNIIPFDKAGRKNILLPPKPEHRPNDVSDFWIKSKHLYSTTDVELKNENILHSLLSAMVPAEPDPDFTLQEDALMEYVSPFATQYDCNSSLKPILPCDNVQCDIEQHNYSFEHQNSSFENDVISFEHRRVDSSFHMKINHENQNNSFGNKSNLNSSHFLPTHVPVIELEYDNYLSHSFEERLEIELMAAGISRNRISKSEEKENIFLKEINKINLELDELQPQIDQIKNDILKNIDSYREDEEIRMKEMLKYNELMREAKSHTKPKEKS